ncbi:MAG: TlpA disulfide reductase family protein [Ferruginibacter sp.]
MKRFLLITLLFPFVAVAQTKPKSKTPAKSKTVVKPAENKIQDGFTIDAVLTGFPDGTSVSLLNGQTGAPEAETKIQQGKFSFKGKMAAPDFRIILFDKKPPYITLFLDNSSVKITGDKNALNAAAVTGSPSHNDFQSLGMQLYPYQHVFAENAPYDSAATAGVMKVTENFIKEKPASHIAALAAIRYNQVAENPAATERLYNMLTPEVQASGMGTYVAQIIAEAKRNAIGTVMDDFEQPDTSGKAVSLSSFRGKYVLVDFWASWCRPCRQENPNVVANYNKYKDKNFTVLGVSLDKSKPAWVDAITMDGLTWSHISDLQGWANSVAGKFHVQSIPQNFLIDPDGKIVAKNLRGPALERALEKLLK